MNYELYPEFPVLIVEDKRHVLNSYEFVLRSNGISNVDCCQYSRDLLLLLQSREYSLILLDLRMLDINGWALIPQIVNSYPELSVIVITGLRGQNVKEDCL